MALRVTAVLTFALALAACGEEQRRMPFACTEAGERGYERALDAVPERALLRDATPISECLRLVRGDADLQNLGVLLSRVADRLAVRARDDADPAAARRLGFLVGAARRGSERSNGISSELARRLERAALKLQGAAALEAAAQEGLEAGRARG